MAVLADLDLSVASAAGVGTGVRVRLSGLVEQSIVDGPGLRMVVFTQGCLHGCAGCQNPETHALDGGFEVDVGGLVSVFCEDPLLSGVTLSGGEPMLQAGALLPLARAVKAMGKSVWCYTGYRLEELLEIAVFDGAVGELLGEIDVLVDGRFERARRSLDLPYRGSGNQRVLRLAECLPGRGEKERVSS